ncbi:transposase [Bacteroides sp. KG123]
MSNNFPKALSYNLFVELRAIVCDNKRISRHKVFAGIAQRGTSSTGWLYKFKLHH